MREGYGFKEGRGHREPGRHREYREHRGHWRGHGHGHQNERGHENWHGHENGHAHGRGHGGPGNKRRMSGFLDGHPNSAQTFRRGRAVAFLDALLVNRSTLQRQLNDPEYESVRPMIAGELKATEAISRQFVHTFQLHGLSNELSPPDGEPADAPDGDDSQPGNP